MHLFVAVASTPFETTMDLGGVLGQTWQPAPYAAELSVALGILLVVVVGLGAAERLLRRARRDQLRGTARSAAAATTLVAIKVPFTS